MKGTAAWFLLLLAGILLIVVGFQGSVGKVFAVAFAPAILEPKVQAQAGGIVTTF